MAVPAEQKKLTFSEMQEFLDANGPFNWVSD